MAPSLRSMCCSRKCITSLKEIQGRIRKPAPRGRGRDKGYELGRYSTKLTFRLLYTMKIRLLSVLALVAALSAKGQDSLMFHKISDEVLLRGTCYENLRTLCKTVGHR